MNHIDETELILSQKKKIYHLNLSKHELADDILLVGDPERVKLISNKSPCKREKCELFFELNL